MAGVPHWGVISTTSQQPFRSGPSGHLSRTAYFFAHRAWTDTMTEMALAGLFVVILPALVGVWAVIWNKRVAMR